MIGISYPIVALIAIIVWIVYRILVRRKNKNIILLREIVVSLFFTYFLVVSYFVFCKMGMLMVSFDNIYYMNIIPLIETIKMFNDSFMGVGTAIYNVVGNILLFIPLGFFLPLLFEKANKFSKVMIYGSIASITIESIQLLTSINITDIDDVIFNTLGAVIGFYCYRIFYIIVKKTSLVKLIERVKDYENKNLLVLAIRPLVAIFIIVSAVTFTNLYSTTFSKKLSDEELVEEAFNETRGVGEILATRVDGDNKYMLMNFEEWIELIEFKEVMGNRYTMQLGRQSEYYGDQYYTFYNEYYGDNIENSTTRFIIYGKNNDVKEVEIDYLGETYRESIKPNDYFIIISSEFKIGNEIGDMYNIYQGEESKDLKIRFLDDEGNEYKGMDVVK